MQFARDFCLSPRGRGRSDSTGIDGRRAQGLVLAQVGVTTITGLDDGKMYRKSLTLPSGK